MMIHKIKTGIKRDVEEDNEMFLLRIHKKRDEDK